ncbi:unnamed protein product [Toxocara canis]|uniref:Peptidase S1 domain-containing protein n=1 Tax=Toxocara canis TaxID=6265 RepID=A0A183V1L9_TOXCA|nr:unnamed protein product [Toxocara canis]
MVMNASGRRAAEEGQFPSAVRVVIADVDIPAYLQKMCTGHVISLRHILIAAHCLQFSHTLVLLALMLITTVTFYNGTIKQLESQYIEKCVRSGTERPRRLKIKSLVIAEEAVTLMVVIPLIYALKVMSSYEGTLYDAESKAEATDFAMLELETPVSVSDPYIRPICLPRPDQQLPIEYRRLGFGAIVCTNYISVRLEPWSVGCELGSRSVRSTRITSYCVSAKTRPGSDRALDRCLGSRLIF